MAKTTILTFCPPCQPTHPAIFPISVHHHTAPSTRAKTLDSFLLNSTSNLPTQLYDNPLKISLWFELPPSLTEINMMVPLWSPASTQLSVIYSGHSCQRHLAKMQSVTPLKILQSSLNSPLTTLPPHSLLQLHWPPFCSYNMPALLLLLGLCTCSSLCLETLPADLPLVYHHLTSFGTSIKCFNLPSLVCVITSETEHFSNQKYRNFLLVFPGFNTWFFSLTGTNFVCKWNEDLTLNKFPPAHQLVQNHNDSLISDRLYLILMY